MKAVYVVLALAACKGPPARLIAAFGDTAVINNRLPVQLSMQVVDATGLRLPNTGVRFLSASGVDVSLSPSGVLQCTHAGDATLRAALGPLSKSVLVRCRPIQKLLGGGPVNLVLGDAPYDLQFAGVDSQGRPVGPLSAAATVDDSMVVALEGLRIRARNPGTTGVELYVGDEWTQWYVRVYEPALTLDGIRPGQHLAVPVRLAGGEMRSWQLPAWSSHGHGAGQADYDMQILPVGDTVRAPRLAIRGAICDQRDPWSARCLAPHGASLFAYHPRQADRHGEWSGTVAVVRLP